MTNEPQATASNRVLNANNLVVNWKRALERRGVSLVDGIDQLNEATGRKYKHHHISRMESGERGPGSDTMEFMMKIVVPDWFEEHGLEARLGHELCESLKLTVDEQ